MAAVIELHTGRTIDPAASAPVSRSAPQLRVIHGGRSVHARHMRRVFLARRLLVLGIALVLLAGFIQAVRVGFAAGGSAQGAPVQVGRLHVVEPGDTLWGLAQAVDPSADTRDVVEQILEMNSAGAAVDPSGLLRAGETVRLPVDD